MTSCVGSGFSCDAFGRGAPAGNTVMYDEAVAPTDAMLTEMAVAPAVMPHAPTASITFV